MDLHNNQEKDIQEKMAEGKPWLQSLGKKQGVIFVNSCLGQPFYHSLGIPCSPDTGDEVKLPHGKKQTSSLNYSTSF